MKRVYIFILLVLGASAGFAQKELSVEQAVSKALENNYDLIVANKNVEISEKNNTWGSTSAMPMVSFNGAATETWNYNDNEDYRNERLSADVTMNWVLFDGFSAHIQKDQLEIIQAQSEGNAAVVIESTIQDVILSYYKCLLEEEKVKVMKEVMDLSHDRYLNIQERQKLGNATTYEGLQAQNSWLEDKSNYLQQQLAYITETKNLNFLMGVESTSEWNLTTPFTTETSEYKYEDLEAKMVSSNSTLKNQYIYLSLLEKETKMAKSEYYPTLSLSAGVGASETSSYYDGMTPDMTVDNFAPTGSLVLSYTIFNGGKRKRAVDIAEINEEIGKVQTEQMVHSLTNQLYQLTSFYDIRKELLVLSEEQKEAANLNLSISEDKFSNGSINSFNYRDVQVMYLNSSLGYLNAVYNIIETDTQLTRMTGGILTAVE